MNVWGIWRKIVRGLLFPIALFRKGASPNECPRRNDSELATARIFACPKPFKRVRSKVPLDSAPPSSAPAEYENRERGMDFSQEDSRCVREEPPMFKLEPILEEDIFRKISTDFRLFLQDRFQSLDENDSSDMQWCISAVDLLDEIRIMSGSYSDDDSRAAVVVRERILKRLAEIHVTIIDKDTWAPVEQRAISVKKDASAVAERIERKGASGIVLDGKIVRKQEVFLVIPEKNTKEI